ncbi:MAG: glycoside hydrolase family 3 C-terminal domain-containing protein, partial [Oscillospiraceae bacterium]|nr:glycoside hydrolase family 3 C-terminal domain-containing protein [Oscillospiraceae bacterium]
ISTRLGIPLLFGIDAIHGHALHRKATIFPSQLALAAAWNDDLIYQVGRVTAREVAADGLHWTFSPVLCLGRDTRWGRIDETFGEDPYLAGRLGAAIVRGYQGDDLAADDSILACAKHYIGYGEATGARDGVDTEMTFRKLREVFLPPFEAAIAAGCATVMTAYGSIDSTPFTASEKALKTILKQELGFEGFIVTDWDNIGHLIVDQKVAADMKEASRLAVNAGNDMMMVTFDSYDAILELAENGKLDIADIDEAVKRILTMKFKAGLFEKPEKKMPTEVIGSVAHQEINLRSARESLVMLENRQNLLPLSADIKTIAVIGPNADDVFAQYGDWTYFSHPKQTENLSASEETYTLLSGLQKIASEMSVSVIHHKGCDVVGDDTDDIEAATAIAAQSDVIVLAVGDVYAQFGETKDRACLSLSGAQLELFKRLRQLNKPIVTVLVASKPLCLGEVATDSDALFAMFNGGQYGGLAVAEAIFGRLNPTGKLPISFPHHVGQLPVYYNQLPGWHGGRYCDLPESPLYSFGYGLSYTEYRFSDLEVLTDDTGIFVSVNVTNVGSRDGVEVVQLYFNDPVSTIITPVKQLIEFERVPLKAKETKTVSFNLDYSSLSLVRADETRVVEPGEFHIMVGGDSREQSLLTTVISIYNR